MGNLHIGWGSKKYSVKKERMFSQATGPKENVFKKYERQSSPSNGSFSQVSSSVNNASFQVPVVKEFFNVADPGSSGISRSYAEALIADDPELQKSIRGLEAMLRVRDARLSGQSTSVVPVTEGTVAGLAGCEADAVFAVSERSPGAVSAGCETDSVLALSEHSSGSHETEVHDAVDRDVCAGGPGAISRVCGGARSVAPIAAAAFTGEHAETFETLEVSESGLTLAIPSESGSALVRTSSCATAGESERIIGSRLCQIPSLSSSGCLSVHACASLTSAPAPAASSLGVCPVTSSVASSAAVAHVCSTPIHNSCPDTVLNSLVERSRKVRSRSTVGNRSVVQTVDMSPAPAAGTYRRSADEVHGQRQISRKRQAVCSVGDPDPGPGPGPGGRSGLVGGSLGCAAAIRGIPCSLVMPPGRHQRAPQSLGWEWVCGSEKSGVWVLKGDTRTYNLPRNLDDVGIVWERRSGYETAWATPGHVCSCSYGYGHGPVLPQPNPSVFTEAIKLWSRVASLLTPWCAKGEVPTGVNLNRYAGDGSFIPWHRDNERLFGSPSEPKVIVSMSLGHSVLFKLCRRASEKTVTPIWLDHGDLLVMDGLTQEEFWHSTASELEGPRVNLTYRWISQHIRSCPQAGLICGALPPVAPDLAEPNSCGGRSRKSK